MNNPAYYLSCLIFWAWFSNILSAASAARILIFSRTAEFRHDSIPTAINALKSGGSNINVTFDSTEDQSAFTDTNLQKYDALLFLSNTGEVLDDTGKNALQNYLNMGGNFIAVHSASDCLRNTSFYGREVGAFFDYHANLQNATVNVIDSNHPSTTELPSAWKVVDEMYNFKSDPRAIEAVVILAADESTYVDNGTRHFDQGSPHPIAWYQEHGAGVNDGGVPGRSFYTSLGHLNETWMDDVFLGHVLGGIKWALQSNTTLAFNNSALVGDPGNRNENGNTTEGSATSGGSAPNISQSPQNMSEAKYIPSTLVLWTVCLILVLGITCRN